MAESGLEFLWTVGFDPPKKFWGRSGSDWLKPCPATNVTHKDRRSIIEGRK